jgi:thioredoxin-related protein
MPLLRILISPISALVLLAATLSAQVPVVYEAPKAGWYADFDRASAAAKREKKDLLVDFTGSDWCGWCIKLHKEVFVHEAFGKRAREDYVLVALDYPRGEELKAQVPNPKRNAELVQRYAIDGYPTVLLMTAEGEVFARTGYQAGGVDTYLKHLDEIATRGRKAVAAAKVLRREFDAAVDDQARITVVRKALVALKGLDAEAVGFATLADVAKRGLALDAENQLGLKGSVLRALLQAGAGDAETSREARTIDPKNTAGLLELAVASDARKIASREALDEGVKDVVALMALGPIRDPEVDLELSINLAFWNHRFLKDGEKAKRYARRAQKLGGDRPEYQSLFKSILGESK